MKKSKFREKQIYLKVKSGNAVDLSSCDITESGDYILEKLELGYMGYRMHVKESGEHFEYVDIRLQKYIQCIGIDSVSGLVLASLDRKFLSKPDRFVIIYKR